ncbi:MAG: hypothetical protein IT557_04630 [Alphaproteobacteria bacterium]|nr:hypothetical protein [Alphaproteobacteria bacterium]
MKLRRWLGAIGVLGAIASSQAFAADRKVMIATWRGCEEACRGVQEVLAREGTGIEVLLRDAGGSRARVTEFLAEARRDRVDLIVTWGTGVSLGMAGTLAQRGNARFNRDIPQVFMIVADPIASGLIESLERPGRRNLTGIFNRVPEEVNIDTIRAYLPGFRRLGLIYNRNEPNSVLKRDEMAGLAATRGFELTAVPRFA